MALVTLLSDFGTADGYVGAMKGVISSLASEATIVDLTHDIAPQDVRSGAWALRQASSTFAAGTIHVAVVDPGVGTARKPLLVRAAGRLYVGPDNGLLSWVEGARDAEVWLLDREQMFRPRVSSTFQGRDIFASVAGHLAAGRQPDDCGSRVDCWELLGWPEVEVSVDEIVGRVVHVDRFGNLISNIDESLLTGSGRWRAHFRSRDIGLVRRTFAEVEVGGWLAYVGSNWCVEIGIRDGSAAREGGERDDEVKLCRCDR